MDGHLPFDGSFVFFKRLSPIRVSVESAPWNGAAIREFIKRNVVNNCYGRHLEHWKERMNEMCFDNERGLSSFAVASMERLITTAPIMEVFKKLLDNRTDYLFLNDPVV